MYISMVSNKHINTKLNFIIIKQGFRQTQKQGGILEGKVARILPGSLEFSGKVLSKNQALLLRFGYMIKINAVLLAEG